MPATRSDVARIAGASRNRGSFISTAIAGSRTGNLRRRGDFAWLMGDWEPPAQPWPASEHEALALPPFGRGIALLANAAASTDWHAERFDPDLGVAVRIPDQPLVVRDPDPTTTPWNYRWSTVEDLVLFGNHFALYGDPDARTSFRPGFLVPIAADQVWIMTDPARPGWWVWTIGGEWFDPDEIFHVSAGNRSGEVLGRGVLSQYCESLGGYVAAEDHAAKYFAGGALPPAVLQSPTAITQEQATELKTKWRDMTSSHEPVVLPMGYILTPVVSNAEQAQLVESRKWNAELVAMMLGIPPWKLGLEGPSMTYQNVETADIDFIRDSADRYARPIVAAFTKWLMPAGTSVVFDYAQRMRADQSTTASVLSTYVAADILDVDEARAAIGRPPKATTLEENSTPADVPELTPTEVTT